MIQLEKINGEIFFVNPDHIRFLDSTPDTILTFQNGEKMAVKTQLPEVLKRITQFRKTLLDSTSQLTDQPLG